MTSGMPRFLPRSTSSRVEWVGLLGVLAALFAFFVPAHVPSLWNDVEFTGWVVPVANRFGSGLRLYADGGHSPMPPLPFAFMRVVAGTHGTWLAESFWYQLFRCATLLLLYGGLATRGLRNVAFWATLASVPVFFALQKTILYDAMAQFLAAAVAFALLDACDRLDARSASGARGGAPPIGPLLLPGALLAALLLTKQSTGGGATIGAVALFLLRPRAGGLRERTLAVLALGATTALAFAAWTGLLALGGLVDVRGMIQDVYLHGAEPKGGTRFLTAGIRNYGFAVVRVAKRWGLLTVLLVGLAAWFRSKRPDDTNEAVPGAWWGAALALAGVVALALSDLAGVPAARTFVDFVATTLWNPARPSILLWTAFLVACLGSVWWIWPRRGPMPAGFGSLAALTIVLLPTALFHSLSALTFRWVYDNNPLIVVVLAALIATLAALLPRRLRSLTTVIGALVVLALSGAPIQQFRQVAACTESWPEIPFLAGARLRPEAAGMRALTRDVKSLAPDPVHDVVLLLPEDPNVQAWFERPRPHFTSAIVFTDQYWDRLVDEDFRRLERRPPRLIVMGPRGKSDEFNRLWGRVDQGIDRLTARIRSELLPARYVHVRERAIQYREHPAVMDVYELRADASDR